MDFILFSDDGFANQRRKEDEILLFPSVDDAFEISDLK